ncbi:hypothetical protein CK203_082077 [Vitis vinifera]|uniref:DUF4283 domain-containing protein n=1 Tax=Vitis vinifera TaxID=29760 RepID=A0A438E1Z3_VITVI|nr:hypothetical protein CK203_082077 [Vitis vinifera]
MRRRRRRDRQGESKAKLHVESKTFELALDERKGKRQFLIVEKKRGTKKKGNGKRSGKTEASCIHWLGVSTEREVFKAGVMDLERKRFCIFLPRGSKGRRKSYTSEIICRSSHENKSERFKCNQDEGHKGGDCWKFTEAGALPRRELEAQHKGRRLGEAGKSLGEFLGLKGKLGLAKLERGRVLLEFEDLREAHHVVSSGSRVMEEST